METTETCRVELKFSKDSRLLAGVSGAVHHMAESCGMDEARRAELVAALEDALQAAFQGDSVENSDVELVLTGVPGRIESVLTIRGGAHSDSRAENIQKVLHGRLDSLKVDVQGETTRITLVKSPPVRGKKR